jgi:hypothetical protein
MATDLWHNEYLRHKAEAKLFKARASDQRKLRRELLDAKKFVEAVKCLGRIHEYKASAWYHASMAETARLK